MIETKLVASPLTSRISDDVEVRVYPDTRPNNLEITGLHKGLVLVYRGREIVGEGAGLGVPVVKYSDKTFFPGTAEVSISPAPIEGPQVVTKAFTLDTISKKRYRDGPYINDRLYHAFHRAFTRVYIPNKPLRPLFDKMMQLRGAVGIHTEFVQTVPRGVVKVEYELHHDKIKVEVDLSAIDRTRCEEVVVLNELGSIFFTRYSDSTGLELVGRDIGPWDKVEGGHAFLLSSDRSLAFGLRRMSGASLYRGWEMVEGRLAWAGLNYTVSPELPSFSYTIQIETREQAV
jgi:hypothetical protein